MNGNSLIFKDDEVMFCGKQLSIARYGVAWFSGRLRKTFFVDDKYLAIGVLLVLLRKLA
jgi:hypothetical protein